MNHCKDCNYWKSTGNDYHSWNACDRIEEQDDTQTVKTDDAALLVTVDDDHGLFVGLTTGPLFGCVKFKEKA